MALPDVGQRGPEGRQGPEGPIGPEGPQGPPGEQGTPGPRGRDGVQGAMGSAGDTGPAGPQGEKGDRGERGPQGDVGPPGKPGIAGAPGRRASDGAPGPQGPPGRDGAEGQVGRIPDHQWVGTKLQFELPNHTWGPLVDLRGPEGKQGQAALLGGGPINLGIAEAPIDGSPYWRKDGGWQVAVTGGSATWGAIIGTLSDQGDLQSALDAKTNSADLADVATSGAYVDLTGKPALGTAAAAASTDFATAAQGAKADSAVQPADIADVVSSTDITTIVKLTQAEYDALSPPEATTLYIVIG